MAGLDSLLDHHFPLPQPSSILVVSDCDPVSAALLTRSGANLNLEYCTRAKALLEVMKPEPAQFPATPMWAALPASPCS